MSTYVICMQARCFLCIQSILPLSAHATCCNDIESSLGLTVVHELQSDLQRGNYAILYIEQPHIYSHAVGA